MLFALLLWFPLQALAGVKVVATVPDLAAIAEEVGREHVEATAMALPSQDPHFVDAKPSLALELSRAQLLLLVGADLEVGWLPTLVTGSRNPKIQKGTTGWLDASSLVTLLEVATSPVDRSMGDVHPTGNPHYLYDPRRAGDLARGIAARLGQIDPPNAATYAANAEDFAARIDVARAGWEARLAPVRGVPVLTYHRSLSYLQDWLGFEVVGTVEPKPGIPPSPQHVASTVAVARERSARLLLQESYYPDTTSQLIAEKSGAKLVILHGGTDLRAGETYIAHMEAMVADLEAALGGGS